MQIEVHGLRRNVRDGTRDAATPEVRITDVTGDTATASPASPLRREFISVFEKGVAAAWGDVPVFPRQSSGATDSIEIDGGRVYAITD